MSVRDELPRRIEQALVDYASQIGRRVSNEEFGRVVAENEDPPREDGPYGKTTVTAWTSGRGRPSLEALMAIAKLLGQHPSVIAFGDAPEEDEEYERGEETPEAAPPEKRPDKTTPARSRRAKPA